MTAIRLITLFIALTTSLSISDPQKRQTDRCPTDCTKCPAAGKFQFYYPSDAVAYRCFQPEEPECENTCTAPAACTPVDNPPPPNTKLRAQTWDALYCVDCLGGYYAATSGPGHFACSQGGSKECYPPIPADCPIQAPTPGWCHVEVTQYQKTPQDPNAKNAGNIWFLFDFKIYDNENWPIQMFSSITIQTNQTIELNVPRLPAANGPIRVTAGADDDSAIGFEYDTQVWNTGETEHDDPTNHFSSAPDTYTSPRGTKTDEAGQRTLWTGFACD